MNKVFMIFEVTRGMLYLMYDAVCFSILTRPMLCRAVRVPPKYPAAINLCSLKECPMC